MASALLDFALEPAARRITYVLSLYLVPGFRAPMHHHRAEHWMLVHGTAKVTRAEAT